VQSARPATPLVRWESWQTAAAVAVGAGVLFSVLLTSVAFGVHQDIAQQLSKPSLKHTNLVDVALIDRILALLTVVVTGAVLCETAIATFVLGTTVMRSRREEVAIRRQSGVLRSTLLTEFMGTIVAVSLIGGIVGEAAGIGSSLLLRSVTVLPVQFTWLSLLSAFPVAIILAVSATLIPAWKSAGASPALLRKGQ
jgi:ABC-type antimicrobial peptide transport system permease subunit